MKIFIVILFSSCMGIAQVTLNPSNFGQPIAYTTTGYSMPNSSVPLTGTTYDFSNFAVQTPVHYTTTVPVTDYPNYQSYPNGNYCEKTIYIGGTAYAYNLYGIGVNSYSKVAMEGNLSYSLNHNLYPIPYNLPDTGTYTVITPYETYTNVKKIVITSSSPGGGISYNFLFTINPFKLIVKYGYHGTWSVGVSHFVNIYNYTPGQLDTFSTSSKKYSLYPNPTAGEFTLNWGSCFLSKNTFISIYDVMGNELQKNQIDKEEQTLSIEDYPTGVYIIKIRDDENGIEFTEKIIKN
jgi:Secretion system C-terminal sorting domain